jgi:hypothetical protein
MRLILLDQCLIIQQMIGLLFKVEKLMDGQLLVSNVYLIHVIQWIIRLRFNFNFQIFPMHFTLKGKENLFHFIIRNELDF